MNKEFEEWFDNDYLFSRKYASAILVSDSRSQFAKFHRIKQVALMLLEDPEKPIEEIRREIALGFFVTMRTALDYINYAKLLIEEFNKQRETKEYQRRHKRKLSQNMGFRV